MTVWATDQSSEQLRFGPFLLTGDFRSTLSLSLLLTENKLLTRLTMRSFKKSRMVQSVGFTMLGLGLKSILKKARLRLILELLTGPKRNGFYLP